GRLLAHSRADGTIALWNVATKTEVAQLKGHHGYVSALEFAPDGKTLASGGRDTTILIWDVSGLTTKAKPQAARDLAARWRHLADDDAARAYDAICALSIDAQAVPFLADNLRPARLDAKRIMQLIADLDSEQFAVRQKASAELETIDKPAAPLIRNVLQNGP